MKYGIPVVVTGNGIYNKIIESSMRGAAAKHFCVLSQPLCDFAILIEIE